jgi:hypothetical protein
VVVAGTLNALNQARMAEPTPRSPQELEISVVLAVGNDEDRVGHQIRSVASHLRRLGLTFEIVAVNDGSTDNSLSIATLLAVTVPELRVLARNVAGRAFLRGTSEARGAIVVLLSASRAASLAPRGSPRAERR